MADVGGPGMLKADSLLSQEPFGFHIDDSERTVTVAEKKIGNVSMGLAVDVRDQLCGLTHNADHVWIEIS
jgi:hypothetical protein